MIKSSSLTKTWYQTLYISFSLHLIAPRLAVCRVGSMQIICLHEYKYANTNTRHEIVQRYSCIKPSQFTLLFPHKIRMYTWEILSSEYVIFYNSYHVDHYCHHNYHDYCHLCPPWSSSPRPILADCPEVEPR